MKHYEVVCALIENENGEIFACKRGTGKALADKWEFPGGKVEEGESHEETIIREIKEELNSTIKPIEYIGESSYEYKDIYPYEPFSITLYGYRCKLISGNLDLSEHTDYVWMKKEDLRKLNFALADLPFLK